ncbi:MAG: exodeoxyribonuclease VII large subunit [Alphaproteobacteria bacterium]|nr:exodeoxyribonuclease VII large subunit [Alphaproteobacteria bacterium]
MSEASPRLNLPEFTVSELSTALRRTVEDAFGFVRVRGEISGLKTAASGHVYFDLKDEKSVLNAIIWRPTARALRLRPEAGMEVVCSGRITTYAGSSRYQLIVEQLELAGTGALMALIEQRKQKLAAEGLFDSARKKPLPFLPELIGVVTSPTGAVIRDILHRIDERFPRPVLLWPVPVQGDRAAAEIAAAIEGFNALGQGGPVPRPDVLIVARGGGSIEDLMAFNDEAVVRAAAASAIPLISAIGHETDTTLIDYAADRRAPTPTAAAEIAVPVRADLISQLRELERRSERSFARAMSERRTRLHGLVRALPRAGNVFAAPRQRLDAAIERLSHVLQRNLAGHRQDLVTVAALLRPATVRRQLDTGGERAGVLAQRLRRAMTAHRGELQRKIEGLGRILESASHRSALARGFALVRGTDGHLRRSARELEAGERLELIFADGARGAVVTGDPRKKTPAITSGAAQAQGALFAEQDDGQA